MTHIIPKKIKHLLFVLSSLLLFSMIMTTRQGQADWRTPTVDEYTKTPPFISREIPPNVIVALDISGSMKAVAYRDVGAGNWKTGVHDDFDRTTSYYGYFDSTKMYAYNSVKQFFYESATGEWDGNFMNWLVMRRMDIVRKVLVGGKVSVKITDQDASSSTHNTIVPINRNKASTFASPTLNWDGYWILEGQDEPYDYQFTKQYASNATQGLTPSTYADNTVFLINEGKLVPQLEETGNVVTLGSEVEMGSVTMDWDDSASPAPWVWVAFSNTYNEPRVVAKSITFNGSHPLADPRIKWDTPWPHTGATGFWVRMQEWDYKDGNHTTETFSYLVVESADSSGGQRGLIEITMDSGAVWNFLADNDSQYVNTTECGAFGYGASLEDVVWDEALPSKPIVFTGVSTWDDDGDTNALVTRNYFYGGADDLTRVGVNIQEQKSNSGNSQCTHATSENLHAIAMIPPGGASTTITADFYNGAAIQAGVVNNVDENWDTITYDTGAPFSGIPLFMGDTQTFNGPDPVSIRLGGSSQTNDETAIQLKLEEETSDGSNTNHDNENVGWVAVSGANEFKIRIGVQTEPTGILQDIEGSMRIGLAVYNYDHTKNVTSIYTGNKVHGGTFYPAYPDMSKPADQRTNYDIQLSCGVHDPVENIYRAIEEHPLIWGTTPIAETLYEIMRYVQQDAGGYYDDKSTLAAYPLGKSTAVDPYYYADVGATLECAETFVLHFNDGAPYRDWDDAQWTTSPTAHPSVTGDGVGSTGQNEMLDDVAYYMRNNDMRSDLSGHQEVVSYYVYAALGENEAYNTSTKRMRESAVNGGFVDYDGDHEPDPVHPGNINTYVQDGLASGNPSPITEWDEDGDYNPDTFYYANNGYQLVNELRAAFQSILERTSSGTAASVISNSRSGEGAIYQSTFYPAMSTTTHRIEWAGQVHALFVDAYGNMREDTNGNDTLDVATDLFIVFDEETVYKYADADADGILDDSEDDTLAEPPGTILDIDFLWSSSDWLNTMLLPTVQRTYTSNDQKRYIFTFVDADNDMVPDTGEVQDFISSSAPSWSDVTDTTKFFPYIHTHTPYTPPYTPSVDITEANFKTMVQNQTHRIVNYVRGEDQSTLDVTTTSGTETLPAFRSRQIDYNGDGTVDTWRMSDIVNSTPTVVGKPSENYELIYRDTTYADFYIKYKKRRNVVYVGANDGMFHAFNAGFYDNDSKAFLTRPLLTSGAPDTTITAYPLGSELWAYVPQNLLPHLFWLTDPDYPHVYYSDMKPKIFDAKIFPDLGSPTTDLHPNGWGTILVAGMRFGGGKIAADVDKLGTAYDSSNDVAMTSAYFIFDITDPESPPTLLAEITFPDLGYTTCYPAVMPMRDRQTGDTFNANDWYLMFGSGPNGLVEPFTDSNSNGVWDTGEPYTDTNGNGSWDDDTYPNKGALTEGSSKQPAVMYAINLVKLATNSEVWTQTSTSAKQFTSASAPFYLTELSSDANSFISEPIAVDWNVDFTTDVLYFGTVEGDSTLGWGGKLRRIVVNNDLDPLNWTLNSTFLDLSDTTIGASVGNGQPIIAAPSAGIDEYDKRWVFFGTGRYYATTDSYNTDQQSYYGLKEPYTVSGGVKTFGWNQVYRATDLYDTSLASVYDTGADVQNITGVTDYDDLVSAVSGEWGWYMNFYDTKERNLGQAVLFGDILTFTSYIPSTDPCTIEGETYLYALNYLTGTAFSSSVIGKDATDTNANGRERILKRLNLGRGLSVTPNIHTGREEGSKAFIQTSTGAIETIEEDNPGIVKSGKVSWLEED